MLDDWKMFLSTIYHLLFCTDSSILSLLESENMHDSDEKQIFSRIQQQQDNITLLNPKINGDPLFCSNNTSKFDD